MRNFRAFCTAFVITTCLVGLGVGLFTVGYGSRRTANGDGILFTYRVEQGQIVFTDQKGHTLALPQIRETDATAPLSPAPVRVSAQLVRGMTALIERAAHLLAEDKDTPPM